MSQNGRAASDEWLRGVLERHESALIRYATRMTGSAEQARDVVQETFVRLCRQKRAELDGLDILPFANRVGLGPRILRAEAAVAAAMAGGQALVGDWRNRP